MKCKLLCLTLSIFIIITGCSKVEGTSEIPSEVSTEGVSVTTIAVTNEIDQSIEQETVKEESVAGEVTEVESVQVAQASTVPLTEIPQYSGQTYTVLNQNQPGFADVDKSTVVFETYSELDTLGRCGVAYTNICSDIMPTEERGEIGMIKPAGWHTIKYDCVDGNYLYNRCHLIAYMLAGENANVQNLITGTRYFNVEGMLPFETQVSDYVKSTNNHVLYRVTPVYDGNNLVASGVQMEAYSVEDQGTGIRFNIFVYNIQPGIVIDYATGDSYMSDIEWNKTETVSTVDTEKISANNSNSKESENNSNNDNVSKNMTQGTVDSSITSTVKGNYILNTNTKKFHNPSCSSIDSMKEKNKQEYTGSRDTLIAEGYQPCKRCNP